MITKPRAEEPATWLLLLHQLPAKPAYARVKLWRRLQALGAVAVKNAVYALPASPQAQEDFEWVLKEIADAGGEGMIVEARLIDGLSDEAVRGAVQHRARGRLPRARQGDPRDREGAPHRRRWRGCAPRRRASPRSTFSAPTGARTWRRGSPRCRGRRHGARPASAAARVRSRPGLGDAARRACRPHRLGLADPPVHRPGRARSSSCRRKGYGREGRTPLRHVRGRVHPRGRPLHLRGAAAAQRTATIPR